MVVAKEKLLLCFVFFTPYSKQSVQVVLLETEKPFLGGGRAAFLNGGSIPLCYGQIFVTIWAEFY
jgi:hypothetical protein